MLKTGAGAEGGAGLLLLGCDVRLRRGGDSWVWPPTLLCVFQMSEAEVNGQFESVCESVFSEVESQAMEALDLPGCFRTRSHSYLRAIQAGYSQDDECIPALTPSNVTSTIRSTAGKNLSDLPSGKHRVFVSPRKAGAHCRQALPASGNCCKLQL